MFRYETVGDKTGITRRPSLRSDCSFSRELTDLI
jgi:hypothetical protein